MLMLRLDDAVKTIIRNGWYTPDKDENMEDSSQCVLRSELEQKCYIFNDDANISELKNNIDEATDIYKILYHIRDGDLYEWLKNMHDNITGKLISILNKPRT